MDEFTALLDLPAWTEHEKLALDLSELAAEAAKVDPEPSEDQKKSGNYRKGHVVWKGLPITIETAKGGYRRGVGKDGKPWRTQMKDHYGYIRMTESEADGDHIDVFLAPDEGLRSELVFIINQVDPATGKLDEHKCVLGLSDEESARACYLRNYEKGWQGLGSITALTLEQFKQWLEQGDTGKAVKDNAFALKAAEAEAFQFGGDVQGVHFRKTLHEILNQHHVPGLAYNDAGSGQVHATIGADADTRNQVLQELWQALQRNPRVHQVLIGQAGKEKLEPVTLGDAQLKTMFEAQGFKNYPGWEHDPAAYRRHWAMRRYRLDEDPITHVLSGRLPALARQQLLGQAPIYHAQLEHPELFHHAEQSAKTAAYTIPAHEIGSTILLDMLDELE